jgi:excisionase family DNA binding protein
MSKPDHHEPDMYLTVTQACALAAIGRTTFYKLLDDPESGLAAVTVRIPGLGHIRIPQRRFRQWIESAPLRRGRKYKENSLDPSAPRGMSLGHEAEAGHEEEKRGIEPPRGPGRAGERRPRLTAHQAAK